ncbi:cytochrome c biogenesis protein CcdA [Macrococcus brunensis]|uniref:Cytochrome c biogenesis protein CcdA n=1 Tax=Macrococcus brunensis TaxID=198483 RepID=A0A4R6BAY0_9STAP|nr:cytochrome c biogenesis protein CcdA [Macrococcus brunensis]TDL94107.1 cytochrome c biogenesis protein CcdA [Macrococcus brunensis]ULG70923.1 cytochrome c biogenesis protein CcdA [Macrococcus brunensis]ULG73259.1 cytochrome c biogenesis protein CcdA [Macrococcus brunensis]
MGDVTMALAFGAGILSFISPCVLPIYPAFLSYITGVSFNDLQEGQINRKAIMHTLLFLLGFSIVYISFGIGIGFVSTILQTYDDTIRMVGGLLMIVFGLMTLGIFTPDFLMTDKKFNFKNRPSGYFGSFVIGIAFAAGWTPCMGPIVGSIISLALSNQSLALFYMILYVLGFCIPFFLLTFFITKLKFIRTYSQVLMKIGGVIMIIMGILLFFDLLVEITRLFSWGI